MSMRKNRGVSSCQPRSGSPLDSVARFLEWDFQGSPRQLAWVNPQYLVEQGDAGADCTGSVSRASTASSVHCFSDLKTQLGNEFIASGAALGWHGYPALPIQLNACSTLSRACRLTTQPGTAWWILFYFFYCTLSLWSFSAT